MLAHTGKVNQIVAVKQGVNDFSKTGVADGQCCGEQAELGSCAGSRRARGVAERQAGPGERCPAVRRWVKWVRVKAQGGLAGLNECASGLKPGAALST